MLMNISICTEMSLYSPLYLVHICIYSDSWFICFTLDTRPLLFTKAAGSSFPDSMKLNILRVTAAQKVSLERLVLTVSQLCNQVLGDE